MDLDVDDELIAEFNSDFNEAYESVVNTLIDLEYHPDNQELVHSLFRRIHTIKGNLSMINFNEISELMHTLETTFDDIRQHCVGFDHELSDVFLLTLDLVKTSTEERFVGKPISADLEKVIASIAHINEASEDTKHQKINDAIRVLDPSSVLETNPAEPNDCVDDTSKDMQFFASLANPLEARSQYWHGRTERIMTMCLMMNEVADNIVPVDQLKAAVYVHDYGMAFYPLSIINKRGKYSEEEAMIIEQHPIDAYLLLQRIGRHDEWQVAAEICLQHHERFDGTGYPKKLSGDKIVQGAKILAIADAFETMTHARAKLTNLKRPLMRAVMEMNKCSGSQFDPYWMEIFNAIIQNMRTEGQL